MIALPQSLMGEGEASGVSKTSCPWLLIASA
jgi:hypothetical protein